MTVTDIHAIVNTMTQELLGETATAVEEDMSNIVDVGKQLISQLTNPYEIITGNIVNKIGRTKLVDRVYNGMGIDLLVDSWTYGTILEKIHTEMPEAVEDDTYRLRDGTSYNQDVFHKSKAFSKFFNSKNDYEIDHSVGDRQLRQSFKDAATMGAFLSMLANDINKSRTVKNDKLKLACVGTGIAETVKDNGPNRVYKLLSEYNQLAGESLTPAQALMSESFLRYASKRMAMIFDYMSGVTTLFNIGETQKFTSRDDLKVLYHSEFVRSAQFYLYNGSSQFKTEYLALPSGATVPYWQAIGNTPQWSVTSSINVVPPSGGTAVQQSNILAVAFDRECCGVANPDFEVTTHYNAKGRFTNYFYHQEASYWFDGNENFVVFLLA